MKSEAMLVLLETAADQLGVRVSYETLQTNFAQAGMRGGKCKVKGPSGMEWRVIIDKRATAEERVIVVASALASFDVTALELHKDVREILRTHGTDRPARAPSVPTRRMTPA
jgi:choline dehydrogenase-like flavoprotein